MDGQHPISPQALCNVVGTAAAPIVLDVCRNAACNANEHMLVSGEAASLAARSRRLDRLRQNDRSRRTAAGGCRCGVSAKMPHSRRSRQRRGLAESGRSF